MQAENFVAERRKSPRFVCQGLKNYFIQLEGQPGMSLLLNLSRHGLGFKYAGFLKEGQDYHAQMSATDSDKRIECNLAVVWGLAGNPGQITHYGAKISQMDSGEKVEILDILYQEWKQKTIDVLR